MSQLEAQLTAETIAAHLLNEPLEAAKLGALRQLATDLLMFMDEQLESVGRAA